MRDETTRAALRLLRRGPLMVTGIAGIGKSWVVRRIASLIETNKAAADPLAEAEIHDGARRDTAQRLAERLTLPDPRRLVIVDALEALAAARSPVLDAIACYHGPLLLAAPPAIWEIAAEAPRFHAFLVSRCRSLVLPPLSPTDRRALLFPASDDGAGIQERLEPLALDPGWGGHPRVLSQVRAILRDPTEDALKHLDEAVAARLSGHADAILAGITSLEREALLAVARGDEIGEPLRGAALSLCLHGALARGSHGWTLADRVLERQLRARG